MKANEIMLKKNYVTTSGEKLPKGKVVTICYDGKNNPFICRPDQWEEIEKEYLGKIVRVISKS